MKIHKRRYILLFIFINMIKFSFAEDQLKVSVGLFVNNSDIPGLDTACIIGTDIIDLALKMNGSYKVIRTDYLITPYSFDRAKKYLINNNFDFSIYGEISFEDGSYRININVWDKKLDKLIINLSNETNNIFEIFTLIDLITVETLEKLTGEHISIGSLEIKADRNDIPYSLYINDIYIGQNVKSQKVLVGKQIIKIGIPNNIGEKIIFNEEVNIDDGSVTYLDLSVPNTEQIYINDNIEIEGKTDINITSLPPLANVYLGEIYLGETPQKLSGVTSGKYLLTLSKPGFIPHNELISLLNDEMYNTEISLKLDLDSDYVKTHLINTATPSIIGGATFAISFGTYILPLVTNGGSQTAADVLMLMPKTAHLAAHDIKTAIILNSLSLASVASSAYFTMYDDENFSYKTIAFVPTLALSIYDIVMAPFAVNRTNNKLIEKYKNEGFPAKKKYKPEWSFDFRIGGANLVSLGVNRSFTEKVFYSQVIGGAFYEFGNIMNSLLFTTTGDFIWFPDKNNLMDFYTGLTWHLSTDFIKTGFSIGGLYGFEFNFNEYKPYCDYRVYYDIYGGIMLYKVSLGLRKSL